MFKAHAASKRLQLALFRPRRPKLAIRRSNLQLITASLGRDKDLSSLSEKSWSIFPNGTVPHL